MSKVRAGWVLFAMVVLVLGCGEGAQEEAMDEAAAEAERPAGMPSGEPGPQRITTYLDPTQGHDATGTAIFIAQGEQVELQVNVENVPPGEHAIHIHQNPECGTDGTAAGDHWNPHGHPHGQLGGAGEAHAGDIGNIQVGDDGTGSLHFTTEDWELGTGGEMDILGHALVLHAGTDDFTTQPSGGAGDRIACGVIERP